jgi:hypothetical protein
MPIKKVFVELKRRNQVENLAVFVELKRKRQDCLQFSISYQGTKLFGPLTSNLKFCKNCHGLLRKRVTL